MGCYTIATRLSSNLCMVILQNKKTHKEKKCCHPSALMLSPFNLPLSINKMDSLGKSFCAEGKKVIVFTTADISNLKLTVIDTLSFTNLSQTKQTQVCVFVDPSKTFQSFLGIGVG